MTSPERVKVVVIGAGQAGLSVAYYLRRFELVADEDFVMLDRAPGPGGAWQHRWSSLRLGTAHRVNDLPGMAELGVSFDTADRALPAKEVVADYYGRFEEHFDLRVRRPMNVRSVVNEGIDLLRALRGPLAAADGGGGAREGVLRSPTPRPSRSRRRRPPRDTRSRRSSSSTRPARGAPRSCRTTPAWPTSPAGTCTPPTTSARRTSATSTSWSSAAAPRRSASCSSSRRSRPG